MREIFAVEQQSQPTDKNQVKTVSVKVPKP